MHPALAVWIWSMAMARAWQGSLWPDAQTAQGAEKPARMMRTARQPNLVRASEYLYSSVAENPLPDRLLDRLADLYWTERDARLGI